MCVIALIHSTQRTLSGHTSILMSNCCLFSCCVKNLCLVRGHSLHITGSQNVHTYMPIMECFILSSGRQTKIYTVYNLTIILTCRLTIGLVNGVTRERLFDYIVMRSDSLHFSIMFRCKVLYCITYPWNSERFT